MSNSTHEKLIWRPHGGRMQTWDLCRRECGLGRKQEETLSWEKDEWGHNQKWSRSWEKEPGWTDDEFSKSVKCVRSGYIKGTGLGQLFFTKSYQHMTGNDSLTENGSDHHVRGWTGSKLNANAYMFNMNNTEMIVTLCRCCVNWQFTLAAVKYSGHWVITTFLSLLVCLFVGWFVWFVYFHHFGPL